MLKHDDYVAVRPMDLAVHQAQSDSDVRVRPIELVRVRDVRQGTIALQAAIDLLELATRNQPKPALVNLDVRAFSAKFGLPLPTVPELPTADLHNFRFSFLSEELVELDRAWKDGDIVKYLDALVDLVYVAVGTALLAGLPFDAAWHAVQRANMTKERATGADDPRNTRPHALNVVKPAGWLPPDHGITEALRVAGFTGDLPA